MMHKRWSRAPRGMVIALAAAAGLAAAATGVVYVNADQLDVMAKPRTVSEVVATVDRSTALQVLERQGRWIKVSVNGKQGYVANTVVSDRPTGRKGQSVALNQVNGGPIPALETAAAVKGLTPDAAQFASGKGLSTSGLKELFNDRDAIAPQDFEQFLTEGRLGQARGQQEINEPALAAAPSGR